jgi:hypothetical protein
LRSQAQPPRSCSAPSLRRRTWRLIPTWRPVSVLRWPMMRPRRRGVNGAMGRGDRRKCTCCRKLFRPDPRNRRHQRYCSAPVCRATSKAASQARWLSKPENQGYFRGPENVARVQLWRSRHPGYWRKGRPISAALQEVLGIVVEPDHRILSKSP